MEGREFARWTPARGVLYERAFRELDIGDILGWATDEKEQEARDVTGERWRRGMKKKEEEVSNEEKKPVEVKTKAEDYEVIMMGAGPGAEIIALGCILGSANGEIPEESKPKIKIQAIDQESWGELARKMKEGMKEEWRSLTECGEGGKTRMESEFVQGDLLAAYSADPSAAPSPLPSPSDSAFRSLNQSRTLDQILERLPLAFSSPPSHYNTFKMELPATLQLEKLSLGDAKHPYVAFSV